MTEPTEREIAKLLDSVRDRITEFRREDVADYLEHREWDDAANVLANAVAEAGAELTPEEKLQFGEILDAMDVPRREYSFLHLDDVGARHA